MSVVAVVEDNNTRVLYERILSSGSLPAEKSRLETVPLLVLLTCTFSFSPFVDLLGDRNGIWSVKNSPVSPVSLMLGYPA